VCRSRGFIFPDLVARLAACAEGAGCTVELVDDLCGAVSCGDERVGAWAQGVVAACHERAVRALFDWAGLDAGHIVDMRGAGADDHTLLNKYIDADAEPEADRVEAYRAQIESMPKRLGCDPWFPVIDKRECAECGKCLEFCPFGVYEMVNDRVRVVHPEKCKNNCPACARTCPAQAVIFPKYDRSPINGGTEKEETTIGVSANMLYTDALRNRLAQRKAGLKLVKD